MPPLSSEQTGKKYPPIPKKTATAEGVRKLLNKCNPSKAFNPDKIRARILRECAEQPFYVL